MTLFTRPDSLRWGESDLPWRWIDRDWHGEPFLPAAGFCLIADPHRLWFFARHEASADIHPQAKPGGFQAELWQHDVAELFIADPVSGRYLEFNLAPNGAWWSCEFTAPRARTAEHDIAMPGISTFSEIAANGAWLAAMSIPLAQLVMQHGFGTKSRVNMTFILQSPVQKFLSAADLGAGNADFHRPANFPRVVFEAMASAE